MIFSVAIFAVLAITNLINTNILATQGALVSETELSTLRLEKENQILNFKIAEYSRLAELESQATQIGFQRTHNIVFAPNTNTFALR